MSLASDRWDPRFAQRANRASQRRFKVNKELLPVIPDCVCHSKRVELIGFEPTTSALQGRRSPN